MKTKKFKVNTPSVIPSVTNNKLQISDRFFAKVKTLSGEEANSTTMYDFKNSKWIFAYSGHVELVEYYTEN